MPSNVIKWIVPRGQKAICFVLNFFFLLYANRNAKTSIKPKNIKNMNEEQPNAIRKTIFIAAIWLDNNKHVESTQKKIEMKTGSRDCEVGFLYFFENGVRLGDLQHYTIERMTTQWLVARFFVNAIQEWNRISRSSITSFVSFNILKTHFTFSFLSLAWPKHFPCVNVCQKKNSFYFLNVITF